MRWSVVVLPALLLGGCTSSNSLYEWGSYQPALVKYTKNSDAAEFEKELRETIEKGERRDSVPPGVYAELGYLLLDTKRPEEALVFFQKEKERFPESAVLMDKMISGASNAAGGESENAS
jgi:hypothetical protein